MKNKLSKVGKCLYVMLACILFFNIFISNNLPWKAKFVTFGVPANSWPGGDSRNIQMAVYCEGIEDGVNRADCLKSGKPVKDLYPEATIPLLNYPPLLVNLYSLFGDQTEEFFQKFWRLNTLLLVAAILGLCWKYEFRAFPLLIFNPVLLLAVERGNTDAFLFSLIFIPLLILKSDALRVFFLGLATSLKIFPIFAYMAWCWFRRKHNLLGVLLGVGLSAPLVILSLIELETIIANTPKDFGYAYGFLSLLYVPTSKLPVLISSFYTGMVVFLLAVFVIFSIWLLRWMLSSWSDRASLDVYLSRLSSTDMLMLLISLVVFLSTFVFFVSYAYRLIFLIPIFLVLAKMDDWLTTLLRYLILLTLWIPVVPMGWVLNNLLCYPLAIGLGFLAIRIATTQSLWEQR